MSKRSPDFTRLARDHYATPFGPAVILSRFLGDVDGFCEPCCGDGALIRHLEALGHRCALALDVEPVGEAKGYAKTFDALDLTSEDLEGCTHIITNPPWPKARGGNGEPTMSLIRHLAGLRPTWMLLSADFMHNEYAADVLEHASKIVSVGRVKWMPGTKHIGMDNTAWYLFDMKHRSGSPIFYPRRKKPRAHFAPDIESLL